MRGVRRSSTRTQRVMIASRLSIAWSSRPAAKEEDVSVIGGKRFFADIRVTADERRALSWAMAGTRLAGPKQADGGIICEFTHTVDSRSLEPESDSIVDIGTNYEESNNPLITIERGRMLNPASGLDEDHVETWLDEVIPYVCLSPKGERIDPDTSTEQDWYSGHIPRAR